MDSSKCGEISQDQPHFLNCWQKKQQLLLTAKYSSRSARQPTDVCISSSTTIISTLTESISTCWRGAREELASSREPQLHGGRMQRWMKGSPPNAQIVNLQGICRHLCP